MKKIIFVVAMTLVSVSAFARPVFPYNSLSLYFGSYGAGIDDRLLDDAREVVGEFLKAGKLDRYMETRALRSFEGEMTLCVRPVNPQAHYELKAALEALLNRPSHYPATAVKESAKQCDDLDDQIGPA